MESTIKADTLYGSAYKSIPLVSAASIAYAMLHNIDIPFALDHQEKGAHEVSAIQEVSECFAMPVVSIITLANIIEFIEAE